MTNKELLDSFLQISRGDEKMFELLFKTFYPSLCHFAFNILKSNDLAEEVVQEVFVKIWEKRQKLNITTSVRNYLFSAVRNRCLNVIEHEKIKNLHNRKILEESPPETDYASDFLDPAIAYKIEESILSLPEKRREIFRLNREEGLKYKEIAEKLNLSVKTVEAQMGLALKTLREKLKDLIFPVFFFFIIKNDHKGKSNFNCH